MTRFLLSFAALCLFTASSVVADQPTAHSQGLDAGDNISMFLVTKVAGADDDGVDTGATICYRCKYGQRPMVMVFTRSTDDSVTKLVKELDAAVANHADDQLKGIVTLIGAKSDDLKKKATQMADKTDAKHVPIVIAKDAQNGPQSYKLNQDTAVTVVLVNHSQVVARHDFAAEKVDVDAVIKEANEMLN